MLHRRPIISAMALAIVSCFPLITQGALIQSASVSGGTDPLSPKISGETFNHPNEGNGFTVPLFGEEAPAFVDRNHEYNGATGSGLPAFLIGAEYIQTANDDKNSAGHLLSVTLSEEANVHLFVDNRINVPASMPWVAAQGFVDTGFDIGYDEGGDGVGPGAGINQTGSVFSATLAAGTHVFENGSNNNMYGVAATGSELFDVTVDIGPNGQRVQSDHNTPFGTVPNANQNGTDATGLAIVAGGRPIILSIDDTDANGNDVGGIDWRDRGDSTNGAQDLVQLGEDFVKNNAGIIRLTLDNLAEGDYDMTTFHVDPSFNQSEAIEVLIDVDGGGFVSLGVLGNSDFGFGGPNGLTTAGVLGTSAEFSFTANGTNPVSIIFDGTNAGDTEVPLSGFRLKFNGVTVPEPTTALLGMMGLAVLGARRRRQA